MEVVLSETDALSTHYHFHYLNIILSHVNNYQKDDYGWIWLDKADVKDTQTIYSSHHICISPSNQSCKDTFNLVGLRQYGARSRFMGKISLGELDISSII